MLKRLSLENVGPAPAMELQFADRLNLLTGDNGLGKSFLLDIAWWALTKQWPADVNRMLSSGTMAKSYGDNDANIYSSFSNNPVQEEIDNIGWFDRKRQIWKGGLPFGGLVIYVQADGSFSVWDPARNGWQGPGCMGDVPLPAYVFSPREVWHGLSDINDRRLCNGLIADWAGWQKEQGPTIKLLTKILEILSPSPDESIKIGALTRISLNDVRDMPTVKMTYGQDVPVLHASSGVRRILALCYLLVWTWQEHIQACKLLGEPTARQLIFMIDEVEAHLHPKWQRSIIRSLLRMSEEICSLLIPRSETQLIITTHSPLILASMEPFFDPKIDKWFDIDLIADNDHPPQVQLTEQPFIRRGDATNWLTSNAFDLKSGGSLEAEQVLEEASVLMNGGPIDAAQVGEIEQKLREVLGDTDPFWIRWRYVLEKKGLLP
ncbi:MAG: AAA family ATPase [Magnetococcales bacterium]|nr:AAA family ATPase [Magnetococcales bacterium]MBF0115938.1 AAA family ATPase [Magnetococcales bacterium]